MISVRPNLRRSQSRRRLVQGLKSNESIGVGVDAIERHECYLVDFGSDKPHILVGTPYFGAKLLNEGEGYKYCTSEKSRAAAISLYEACNCV